MKLLGPSLDDDFVRIPSGLILPEYEAEHQIRKLQRPKAMDFFAGCGGFSLGMIQAGYEVIAACELWEIAVLTYMSNLCRWGEVQMHFVTDDDCDRVEKYLVKQYRRSGLVIEDGEIKKVGKDLIKKVPVAGNGWIAHEPRSTPGVSHIFVGDVRNLTSKRILDTLGMKPGELDCICGSPPCQGFSNAGKRDVMDPRSTLVFDFARFVVEMRPKTMVMENVPGILSMTTAEGDMVMDRFCRILEDGGFGGYDAFRRTLEAQGAFGLMAGQSGGHKTKAQKKREARNGKTKVEQTSAPPTEQSKLMEAAESFAWREGA
jgi:DNA (cytosine-5)-methyltransferase 1